MNKIPADEFPLMLAVIQGLGETDVERAAELGVKHPKTVERLRKRIPAQLWPFLKSRHAIPLLRAMLADLERAA
jgi:hypothetical protein